MQLPTPSPQTPALLKLLDCFCQYFYASCHTSGPRKALVVDPTHFLCPSRGSNSFTDQNWEICNNLMFSWENSTHRHRWSEGEFPNPKALNYCDWGTDKKLLQVIDAPTACCCVHVSTHRASHHTMALQNFK